MQLNFKNDITQPVIFNTPKGLNLSELFPTFSEEKLDKVRYIIHQCNFYSNKSGYNLDLTNHRWFLSLTRNDLTYIKKVLIESSVIKLSIKGSKGTKSDHFKMVQPFNYLNESTINKHFFYVNTVDCPLWVQRYIADDSACRNAKTTQWVKRPNDWQPETVQPFFEKASIVLTDDKDAYIKLLEAALIANNIALPIMDSTPELSNLVEPEAEPVMEMAGGHVNTDLTPEVKPEAKPVERVKQIDKAMQLLAGLKAKVDKPIKAEPVKLPVPTNFEYAKMESFTMANSKLYFRATSSMVMLDRIMFEREIKQLVAEGFQGFKEIYTCKWHFNFNFDAAEKIVTLLTVSDAEMVA